MRDELTPPLFFWEPNDLTAFDSLESACRHLEVDDVRNNGLGLGFDAEGTLVVATIEKGGTLSGLGFHDRVRLSRGTGQKLSEQQMIDVFREFLRACGRDVGANVLPGDVRNAALKLALVE